MTLTTMPTTRTQTLYTFSELPDDAQAFAIEAYRHKAAGWLGTDWADEWRESRHAIEKLLSITFGRNREHAHGTTFPSEIRELRGVRLWKWLQAHVAPDIAGEYPFTGYCGDEAYLAPLRAFLARPSNHNLRCSGFASSDIDALAIACIESGDAVWERDSEYQCSDEAIRERLEDDGDEYLEDGREA